MIYLAAQGLNCGMQDLLLWHVGSSSQTRDQTQAPCVGSPESQPLDHQGSPQFDFFKIIILHNILFCSSLLKEFDNYFYCLCKVSQFYLISGKVFSVLQKGKDNVIISMSNYFLVLFEKIPDLFDFKPPSLPPFYYTSIA